MDQFSIEIWPRFRLTETTLEDEKASRNTKLNAAKIVYDNVFRYNEQRNIIEQMEELRELFKERAL